MPIISKKHLHELESKVEVYENLITELPVDTQREVMENLAAWEVFSQKIYQNVKDCEAAERLEQHKRKEKQAC